MKMKKYLFGFLILPLIGAGCASGEQAAIKSPISGKESAPVTIVEYYDYQCGACGSAHKSLIPFLMEDFVNSGKAKIVYKNMAFLGQASRSAANASLCAHEQGKFVEYHDKLFKNQGQGEKSNFSSKTLKQFGKNLGLDIIKFDSCVSSNKYRAQVIDELNNAKTKGITATPTFVINGEKVVGASYLSVKGAIDRYYEKNASTSTVK
tara:strand:- start:139 stop:759 length:621 start_codon:yes stop_codon:yes gene_type:complete